MLVLRATPRGGLRGRLVPHSRLTRAVCTSLVSYWAKETLLGTKRSGLDWEQKGLSNDQYAIHEDAVAAGRAEERTAGRDKALELIDRFVARRCDEQAGAAGGSETRRPPV
ncbi:hypothetical protein [Streptomyces sp. TN58]|uniref:hypothetical protein n=1 Tax=Streptomyces sp. TN58 TaxID=234612 RepID=UPI001F227E3B|nr:hypothetical protein [Streptomyces sp. TN58]